MLSLQYTLFRPLCIGIIAPSIFYQPKSKDSHNWLFSYEAEARDLQYVPAGWSMFLVTELMPFCSLLVPLHCQNNLSSYLHFPSLCSSMKNITWGRVGAVGCACFTIFCQIARCFGGRWLKLKPLRKFCVKKSSSFRSFWKKHRSLRCLSKSLPLLQFFFLIKWFDDIDVWQMHVYWYVCIEN